MENVETKKDFGSVLLKNKIDIYDQIKTYMKENGYNTKYCDVCSVNCKSLEKKDIVIFKFVHHSTPTMSTEPYYKIEFTYAE
jgi:hypothetical protein